MDFSVAEEENNDANEVGKDVLGNGDVISVNMVPLHMRNTSLKSTSTAWVQGDQAACPKPPVGIDLKLRFSIRTLY